SQSQSTLQSPPHSSSRLASSWPTQSPAALPAALPRESPSEASATQSPWSPSPARVLNHQGTHATPPPSRRDGPATQRRTPARDTDEIQINIGRIEVTAVPPPPPQAKPTPASPRKSPSLDEYLKRRPGRVR